MRFEIIGTGSIGLLFAVKLQLAGCDVRLWTRSPEQAQVLERQGVAFHDLQGAVQHGIKLRSHAISSPAAVAELAGEEHRSPCYAILAVKQAHLQEELLHELTQLASIRNYAAIVALQNGCGHIEKLAAYMKTPVLTAVTSEAAKRLDRSVIAHTGQGETWIGDELARDIGAVHQKNIEKMLEKAGFTAFMSKTIKEQVYRKLIRNAVINPLTALFDVANGELPQSPLRRTLMKQLFNETKQILLAEQPNLATSSFDDILQLCEATAGNTSSMRADLLAGAVTEVSYINGAVAHIAARHQIPAPLNESIVHMIEALHPER